MVAVVKGADLNCPLPSVLPGPWSTRQRICAQGADS